MIILDVNKLSKSYGTEELFNDVSFSLNEGESLAIVGPNGCGKSTILKIIAGIENCDSGTVSIKKGSKVAYLDQMGLVENDNRSVYEILKDSFEEINKISKLLKDYEKKMENDYSESTIQKYCTLMEEFNNIGGYEVDSNINTVVNGLNINKDLLDCSYSKLSGGEKTLIQLAKALLIKPDLILLDEPTNHLDIK